MLGVTVNTAAIIAGAGLGLALKKFLTPKVSKVIMQALGLSVLAIGILDAIKTENILVLALSLVLGGVIGSLLRIQDRVEKFGKFLERKLNKSEEGTIGKAFVTATLIFCVGAMMIYGSIQSGLGQHNTLYVKSILDGVLAMLLASTLGWGVMLSAVPVFILQGTIALCANLIEPYAIPAFMNQLSGIGGVLVMCIGINLLEIKEIRTADLTPAILGSIAMFFL